MKDDMINERLEACRHVEDVWTQCLLNSSNTVKDRDFRHVEDSEHMVPLHDAIWYASTEILPNLEVQAIIDAKNDIYVSTDGHYGFWEHNRPNELEIYVDGEHEKTQKLILVPLKEEEE